VHRIDNVAYLWQAAATLLIMHVTSFTHFLYQLSILFVIISRRVSCKLEAPEIVFTEEDNAKPAEMPIGRLTGLR